MKRIRSYSMQILDKNKDIFGTDFTENKMAIPQVAVIRSKQVRNEIAGYITRVMKDEKIKKDDSVKDEIVDTVT